MAAVKEIASGELPKKRIEVAGLELAYVDEGSGDPVLFLHGNPTSAYLWRNIIPHLSDRARCLAPDLVGMGDSDPLPETGPGTYRFRDHRKYVDGFIEALGIGDRLTLVVHDWGSALGFHWAARHPGAVRGIAYMEAIVRTVDWDEWPEASRGIFQGFRSPKGEELILNRNLFVERVLPGSVLREMSDAEMEVYRRPFLEPGESRRPTLTWPREIPVGGTPGDVCAIVDEYAGWLPETDFPKLFVNAEPGAILVGPQREFCRTWRNQTEVTVKGSHFIQEDSPHEIGRALQDWFGTLP